MNTSALKYMLIRHEGLRLKPYRDTAGKLTIGVGRNLDDDGITEAEASIMLEHDIQQVLKDVAALPFFDLLNDARQAVLADMAFNMGISELRKFTKMLAALAVDDYNRAAYEMINSVWARQVGRRAVELATMMRQGAYIA